MDASQITKTIAEAEREAGKASNAQLASKASMETLNGRVVKWQAELDQATAAVKDGESIDRVGSAAFSLALAKRQVAFAKATR